jgi:hypothetical protein
VTASAEPTLDRLRAGDLDGAWSTFVDRYRRLIFAQIRRATTEPDGVMDIFAHVCERLRENDLARLKRFAFDPAPRASFATWLVAVVRNLIVDLVPDPANWAAYSLVGRRGSSAGEMTRPQRGQLTTCTEAVYRRHRSCARMSSISSTAASSSSSVV